MPIGAWKLNSISAAASAAAESYFILTSTDSLFYDNRYSIDVDTNKNIYLGGYPSDFEAFKISETGSFTWQKAISSSMVSGRNIFVDGSKVLIAGHDNTAPNSLYLLGLNSSDGTSNFSTRRQPPSGSSMSSSSCAGKNTYKDSSGNYYTVSVDTLLYRIVVSKFSSTGSFTSSLHFTIDGNTTNAWQVTSGAMDSTNNLHLLCYRASTQVGYLVKIDVSAMTITWAFSNSSSSFASSSGMAIDSSGNIYLRRNRWLQKFDSSGTQQWQREISVAVGNDDSTAESLDIDSSNNIYVGFVYLNKNHILKVDSSGNVVWSRSFSTNNSSNGNLAVRIKNGQIYFAGRGQVSGTTTGMWIAKLPTDGTKTGTYATTLVYATESITLSSAGPFSQTSVSTTTTARTMTSQTITPTISNAGRGAGFTKTTI